MANVGGQAIRSESSADGPFEFSTRSRPPAPPSDRAVAVHLGTPGLAASLEALVRSTGASIDGVLRAGWALVSARHAGHDAVSFGYLDVTSQGGEQFETIALRLDDTTAVARFIQQLAREGAPAASSGPADVVLARVAAQPAALDLESVTPPNRFVPDLLVEVWCGEPLTLRLTFDGRRFRPAAVDRLAAAFLHVLSELAADPTRAVGAVPVIPPDERQKILVEWNDTSRPFPDDALIHEPFERMVDAQPDAVAVETEAGETISYRELDARANRLAQRLCVLGAAPGRFVGVCFPHGLDLVIALLAVEKTGAAYLPLDPRYPPARLAFMLADAEVALVISADEHRDLFSSVTCLGLSDPAVTGADSARPERIASASDSCYAMFTSGSTGMPNGVVLSHRAVMNTLDWVARTFQVGRQDRALFVNSPGFDLSVWDVFGTLGAGGTLVVLGEATLAEPAALARALVDRRITIWNSAPAALGRLMPFVPAGSLEAPLRLALLSGDWIPLSLPGAVRTAFPGCRVVSLGGATEAAIWSNFFLVDEIDPEWVSIPYGRPIQNARYHVLDAKLRPVPVGTVGDLYIGGTCLADGYLNRAELTESRFIGDPFRSGRAERLFKTGDLARYRDDGQLEFMGRADHQVKVRGFRVEMGEVEAAITALAGIRAAVCAAYDDASGQKSLAAFIVRAPGVELAAKEIKDRLARTLPEFMVPARIAFVSELPLTSNGKVDYKALPTKLDRGTDDDELVPPRNQVERSIAEIWKELLELDRVGVHDSFFDVGGHSLLAVMLVDQLKSRAGIEVSLAQVMANPTIAGLARPAPDPPLSTRHILTFNTDGRAPPLVLFPDVYGNFLGFLRFPELLGPDQPIYLGQAVGADADDRLVPHTIERIVDVYEQELIELCPPGPILLGGYSFGTLLAFELAGRLKRRGFQVPLLVFVDGYAPGYPEFLPLGPRVLAHLRDLGDAGRRPAYLRERGLNLRDRVLRRLGQDYRLVPHPDAARPEVRQRLTRLWTINAEAHARYRPRGPEACGLLLVRAQDQPTGVGTRLSDPHFGWQRYIDGPITTVTVSGDHRTVLQHANQSTITAAIVAAARGAVADRQPNSPVQV